MLFKFHSLALDSPAR